MPSVAKQARSDKPIVVPPEAVGLRLYKIVREQLIACELVIFAEGAKAVDTVLRRARISGHVEIGGDIGDYYADIYVDDHTWVETVALDRDSYSALKNKWMRCQLDT